MNEFARQLTAKYARRGRPPLTEDVQALLAFHADAADGRTQSLIADAIEEGGLPMSREDLDQLREDPRKLYVHPHGLGYRVLPEPVLTMADIRRRNRASGHHFFTPASMRTFGSRPHRKVHQGPGGTFFVDETDNFDGIGRQFQIRRFDARGNRVESYVHPEGRYGDAVPYAEYQWFNAERPPTREAAHALAAHLAEHGRLPENNNE